MSVGFAMSSYSAVYLCQTHFMIIITVHMERVYQDLCHGAISLICVGLDYHCLILKCGS